MLGLNSHRKWFILKYSTLSQRGVVFFTGAVIFLELNDDARIIAYLPREIEFITHQWHTFLYASSLRWIALSSNTIKRINLKEYWKHFSLDYLKIISSFLIWLNSRLRRILPKFWVTWTTCNLSHNFSD